MNQQNDSTDGDEETDEDEEDGQVSAAVTLYVGRDTYIVPPLAASCFQGLELFPRLRGKPRLVTKPHPALTRSVGLMSPIAEPKKHSIQSMVDTLFRP
jgi:hypothetical protein